MANQHPLSSMPYEVAFTVSSHIANVHDLGSLASTSRGVFRALQPVLAPRVKHERNTREYGTIACAVSRPTLWKSIVDSKLLDHAHGPDVHELRIVPDTADVKINAKGIHVPSDILWLDDRKHRHNTTPDDLRLLNKALKQMIDLKVFVFEGDPTGAEAVLGTGGSHTSLRHLSVRPTGNARLDWKSFSLMSPKSTLTMFIFDVVKNAPPLDGQQFANGLSQLAFNISSTCEHLEVLMLGAPFTSRMGTLPIEFFEHPTTRTPPLRKLKSLQLANLIVVLSTEEDALRVTRFFRHPTLENLELRNVPFMFRLNRDLKFILDVQGLAHLKRLKLHTMFNGYQYRPAQDPMQAPWHMDAKFRVKDAEARTLVQALQITVSSSGTPADNEMYWKATAETFRGYRLAHLTAANFYLPDFPRLLALIGNGSASGTHFWRMLRSFSSMQYLNFASPDLPSTSAVMIFLDDIAKNLTFSMTVYFTDHNQRKLTYVHGSQGWTLKNE